MSETKSVIDIGSLELSDFDTPEPYQYLWSLNDEPWSQDREFKKIQTRAKELKFTGFLAAWRAYVKQQEKTLALPSGQITDFKDMPYTVLGSGRWICTNDGVYTTTEKGDIIACPHPILITERFEELESGVVKVKLAFKLGHVWRDVIVERSIIASAQKIIALADLGVGVTSESAKFLVQYLAELEMINYAQIPTKRSVSRLGWITPTIFSPYEDDIEFDGHHAARQAYEATKPKGLFTKWRDCMLECLSLDDTVRLVMAASFASPLLKPIGALSNVVHLFATTSTGKTMILKMAASIWADPEPGKFIKSFNSTTYAQEEYMRLFNGMPAILDELQINREKFGGAKRVNLYQMTQGSSGGRGRRDGGLRDEAQWKLSFITSGEEPIAATFDAGGAYARMIELHLTHQVVDLPTGLRVSKVIDKNYGHAGRKFIDAVFSIGVDGLRDRYDEIVQELQAWKIQPKQAMAAGTLLLAYEIANGAIFEGKAPPLAIDDITPHLLTEDELDATTQAYALIQEWIAANENRFSEYCQMERIGVIENGKAYIIRSQFNKFIESVNLSPRSVLSGLADRGLIETTMELGKKRYDASKRVGGVKVRAVVAILDDYEKPQSAATTRW